MEKVINRLFEIEEKANRIMENSNVQKQKMYDQLNSDLEKLDHEIKNDTNSKLEILRAKMNDEIAKERQALIDDCNSQINKMEQNFNQNHAVLVDTVFNNITQV